MRKWKFRSLFKIQYECFEPIFKGHDLVARSLTGSGKTLAFGLPLIEYFRKENRFGSGKVLSLILAPTRELAQQTTKELKKLRYENDEFRILTVYGGSIESSVGQQARMLQ